MSAGPDVWAEVQAGVREQNQGRVHFECLREVHDCLGVEFVVAQAANKGISASSEGSR